MIELPLIEETDGGKARDEAGVTETTIASGGAGELLTDFSNVRSDSILICKMLGMGVVPESEAKELITKAHKMAKDCKSVRNFRAIMSVLIELMKVSQKERMGFPNSPSANVNVNLQSINAAVLEAGPEYLEYLRRTALGSD